MTDVRAAAVSFEAVKVAMKQDRNGYILTLAVHPNDMPADLFADWVGQRYQVAMVKMDDEGNPVPRKSQDDGAALVRKAGMLCQSERFQRWMEKQGFALDASEDAAAAAIRGMCGIASRSDLKTSEAARETFEQLLEAYEKHVSFK